MANFSDYGAPQMGLRAVKIATWNATNNYGAAVQIPSVQLMGAVLRIIAAELTGDDKITASSSRAIGGSSRVRFGSVSMGALEVVVGNAPTASVASPNRVRNLRVRGGDRMPYFGMVGQALAEEGLGDFLVFLPKVKIMSDVTLATLEYGTFAIPEVEVSAVDDESWGIINLIERESTGDFTIPPANIAIIA